MSTTPNLNLPYLLAAQAQKHVTLNEALRGLDCIVQLAVQSRMLTSPPATPADGERYIVAASPTGVWSGQAHRIAAFQDGAWAYFSPREGWTAWVSDEDSLLAWNGSAWVSISSGGSLDSVPMLGVNATADVTNRLSVSSEAALFNHAGAGHQIKVNKNAAGDTASFLFQTGYSGRAEIGLTGNDDFHFKVSADGSLFKDAIVIDRSTGVVTLPLTPGREILTADRTYYVRTDGNNSNSGQVNSPGGAFLTIQRAIDVAASLDLSIYNVTIQLGAGTYSTTKGLVGRQCVGSGYVTIIGDETTPANVVLSMNGTVGEDDGCFAIYDCTTTYRIRGVTLISTATGAGPYGLHAHRGGKIQFQNIRIGTGFSQQIRAADGGSAIVATGPYTVTAGATNSHLFSGVTATVRIQNVVVTITGTPNFASGFASCIRNGVMIATGSTFAGTATGIRYSVSENGTIAINGAGENFFPGNVSGTKLTGGQYT